MAQMLSKRKHTGSLAESQHNDRAEPRSPKAVYLIDLAQRLRQNTLSSRKFDAVCVEIL